MAPFDSDLYEPLIIHAQASTKALQNDTEVPEATAISENRIP
jgi:hypothetical protein